MSSTLAQHHPPLPVNGGSLDGLLNKVSIGAAVNGWTDYRGGKGSTPSPSASYQVNGDQYQGGGGGGGRSNSQLSSGMSHPIPSSSSQAGTDSGYGMSISPGGQSIISTSSSIPPPTSNRSQPQWQRDFPPPLAPRNWTVLKEVGDGSFGTVWLADWHSALNVPPGTQPPGPSSRPEYKGKQLVAIKRMKKAFDGGWDECMKLKELKSLRQIPMHPNIIPLYDAFLLPTTRELYFVFECMEGNLYQLTKSRKGRPLASGLVASIFYQILSGLNHIHAYGYFHRDMKPENLLITTTGLADYPASSLFAPANTPPEKDVVVVVKLADFGLAREITSKPPYTEYVSTRWYRAPEVLLRSRDYSVPVDMWALGTILVEVLTLKPLFPGDSEVDQVYKICEVLGDPSTEYGTDERGRVKGGGNWSRGIKMAKDVGFSFPKIVPRMFANLFDHNVVPVQLIDCIQDLLRYEPKARLTTQQCLEHPYFREVAYRFAPYSPQQLRQRQQQQANGSHYSANGSNLSVNTNGLSSMGNPSQASPRNIPPSHSHDSIPPQPHFNPNSNSHFAAQHAGQNMQRSYSISSTLSGASALSSTYPVQVVPSSPSGASQQGFPEGVSDARSINSFSPSAHSPNPMWSGENGWNPNDTSNASMRIPSFGGSGRRPSIAPSIAASTFYDGSIFEGIAPTRASSIMSFPVNYGNGDGASIYQSMDSPQLNRVNSIASVNPPVAGPSSSNRQNGGLGINESSLPSSMSVKSGKWGFFGGDKSSSSSTPTFPNSPAMQSSTSLNPLKRSPSNNSIAATAASQASPVLSLDPKKAKKEAEKLAKEQEKANRLAKEQAARERARAVMKKKSQLQEAADPLHNFSNHARGTPGGGVPVDKGKGRAVMSDRMVQQRMPQIIEDTSKLYLSPSAARSAGGVQGGGGSSVNGGGGGEGYYPALLSTRFKARRRDDDDDVHSVSSTDTGQSSQYGGPSGIFPARGRPFSISSKATSSSDPERRSRNELAEIDLHLNRAGSVASLPLSSHNHYSRYHAPSTGHSSLESSLINNMQGLATSSTTDLSWNPPSSSATRSDSQSRQRVASPPHHEQRYSPYQLPSSPIHARSPGPTLAPIQYDPNTQYSAAGHGRLGNGPSPSGHPVLSSSASIASYHSTPGVLPSYFVQQQQKGDPSRQLPYLPSMDHETSSPGPGSTFPFNTAPSPANSSSPDAHR